MNDISASEFVPKPEKATVKPVSVMDQLRLLTTTLDQLDQNLVKMDEDFHARIEEMRAILLGAVK